MPRRCTKGVRIMSTTSKNVIGREATMATEQPRQGHVVEMPSRRYDWETIRSEYVTGSDQVTLEGLAAKHGPRVDTVRRRSAREHWVAQREEHRRQSAKKAADLLSSRDAEIRVRHMRQARELQELALARLRQLDPSELTTTELRLYLKDACEIERKAAGIPDEVSLTGDALNAAIERELARLAAVNKGVVDS